MTATVVKLLVDNTEVDYPPGFRSLLGILTHERLALKVNGRTWRSGPNPDFDPDKLEEWSEDVEGKPFLVLVQLLEDRRIRCYFIPLGIARNVTYKLSRDSRRRKRMEEAEEIQPHLVFHGSLPEMMKASYERAIKRGGGELGKVTHTFGQDITRFFLELLGYEITESKRSYWGATRNA